MAFHLKDGWFFRCNPDRSVTVAYVPPPHAAMFLVSGADDRAIDDAKIQFTTDENGWASVVASMSAYNESDGTFYDALTFHRGEGRVLRGEEGE